PSKIPVDADGDRAFDILLEVSGWLAKVNCVSMGNPHAVIFLEEELIYWINSILKRGWSKIKGRDVKAIHEILTGLNISESEIEKVAKKLQNVSTIRVTTELGTDITLPIKNRTIIKSTGILRNIGEYGNLPSGEVYLAPWEKQSNGVIVFDGSIAGIGILKHPVKVVVEDGYGVDFEGDEEAKQLYDMLKSIGHEAFAIGEFGIGTNYKAKITGIILEDEKVLGTVHIAFGNNLTMGGKIKAKGHIDGIITKPNVYFDDKLIMKEGKLLI
ncbi:MAG: aminopeptidase, partial [Candidatus Kapaibacteriota bacterium]